MAVCSVANTPCVSFANATCLDEIRSLLENCIDAVGLLVGGVVVANTSAQDHAKAGERIE
jgi:hypothetical protein